jgi:hypothetical protein
MTIPRFNLSLLAWLLAAFALAYAQGEPLAPVLDPQIMPPPEFDYEYTGHMVITRGDEASTKTECWGKSGIGCALRVSAETCFVFIAYDDVLERQRYSYGMVLRHERAHCNGWKHSPSGVKCWANSCD